MQWYLSASLQVTTVVLLQWHFISEHSLASWAALDIKKFWSKIQPKSHLEILEMTAWLPRKEDFLRFFFFHKKLTEVSEIALEEG